MKLAEWITPFATRHGLLLYHDLTGRTCRVDGDEVANLRESPRPAELEERLRIRGFLVEEGTTIDDVIAPMVPMHGRWSTFCRPKEGPPVLAERLVGEPNWTARTLRGLEATLWLNATGQVTVADLLTAIEEHFGPEGRASGRETLLRWTHGSMQLIKLLERPIDQLAEPPPHLFSLIHHYPIATDWRPGEPVDLERYHQQSIVDAADQFDQRETTLSHLLRFPSPVLSGRSFGEALIENLAPLGGARCLEVGGGTGWLAQRILETRPDLDYTIVDLSPALSAAQAKRLANAGLQATTREGNALDLPMEAESVDLLLNNEVVADLAAERVDPTAPPALIDELGVVPESPRLMNVGALAFLKEIHRVLKPGGRAYLMEYGAMDEEPIEARHLDHPEVGIEWGVMARAADNLGFANVEVVDIGTLLGFSDEPILCLPAESFNALNALIEFLGAERLEKRAITMSELRSHLPVPLETLNTLHFESAKDRVMSFRPQRMLALLLTK